MRLLVTGANGQLGWELARSLMILGEVIALTRDHCDLSRPQTLEASVAAYAPDVLINAAAYTAVERAETEQDLAMTVNAEASARLAEICRQRGILLVHYSTDFVFDGTKETAYVETDAVAPLNVYGWSKLKGEQGISALAGEYLIFRTSWVYAARGHNFLQTMLRLGREQEKLSVVANQFSTPNWTRNLADATALILSRALEQRRCNQFRSGLFHLSSQGKTSWHGFASTIFQLAQEPLRVRSLEAIRSEDYATQATRPRNSQLNSQALQARFGVLLPSWQSALQRCLQDAGCGQ